MNNTEIINNILETLYTKISRRTNEKNAESILNRVILDLKPRYSYLSVIKIKNTYYEENAKNIQITYSSIIDKLNSDELNKCIVDIFELTVKYLKRDADYFFIKEFKDAINNIDDFILDEKNIDFNQLQYKYLINSKQNFKIKNSEIFKIIFDALIKTIIKLSDSQNPYILIESILSSSYKQFDFLNEIQIIKDSNSKDYCKININSSLNYIPCYQIEKTIKHIIKQVFYLLNDDNKNNFIESLKHEISNEDYLKLKKIDVNLNKIQFSTNIKFDDIIKKVLTVLELLLSKEYSNANSFNIINNVVFDLQDKYEFLNNIYLIDEAQKDNPNIFQINSDINLVTPYKFAKSVREIINMTSKKLQSDKSIFINEFKKGIGDAYLFEIDKIGVNLHFLEMKFSFS